MTEKEDIQAIFLNIRKTHDGDLNEILKYLKELKIEKGIQALKYLAELEGLTTFEKGYIKHLIKTEYND